MTTVREHARDLICKLETFLTKEKWGKDAYVQDEDGVRYEFNDELLEFKGEIKFCELGGLAYVFHDLYGVWIDPDSIPDGVIDVWNEGAEEYLSSDQHEYQDLVYPLSEEQVDAITLAYRTLLQQGGKVLQTMRIPPMQFIRTDGTVEMGGIPQFNDSLEYEQIRQLNEQACAVLRDTPTCEGAPA